VASSTHTLRVEPGVEKSFRLIYREKSTQDPIDLTGKELTLVFLESGVILTRADFTVDDAAGIVDIVISEEDVALIPQGEIYRFKVDAATILKGLVYVDD